MAPMDRPAAVVRPGRDGRWRPPNAPSKSGIYRSYRGITAAALKRDQISRSPDGNQLGEARVLATSVLGRRRRNATRQEVMTPTGAACKVRGAGSAGLPSAEHSHMPGGSSVQRIIVLGAGFAGLWSAVGAARALD